jgi:signal transduction histidine kinase/CheY-like chemotaxis protein
MVKTSAAAVLLGDRELRAIALDVLAERGYRARAVDRPGATAAIAAGNLALVEFGPAGLEASDLLAAREVRLLALSQPILAAVDCADVAACGAALAAGATALVQTPFDRAGLTTQLIVAERWADECTRFGRLLEQLPVRVMVFAASGQLVFANRTRAVSPVDELLAGRSLADLPRELGDAIGAAAARAHAAGAPVDHEAQASGVWFLLRVVPLAPGDPAAGFAVVAVDITEHRRAEHDLRASSSKANALLDALPDMVFRYSAAGVLLDFRAERVEMLAQPPDQIIGRTIRDTLPPEVAGLIETATARALETGTMERIEYRLEMPGGLREYEARIVASGVDEVIAIVRDMTELKHLQARLALADRLAALGTLSAGVAHEINNPLTYILIGIESVLKELRRRGPDQALGERMAVLVERLQGAMEGARRVRRIVSDLRTFGRADEESERLIDPRVVLDAAASMVDSHIRYRARLLRDYREVPQIVGNHDRLVQVFVNLLLNAAQALGEAEVSRNTIRLGTHVDETGRVVIEVEDSGAGIPSAEIGQIFDPFFTTKPVGEGTGLGLWVCHSIVTGHGGSIAVRSRVGEGTTFRVVLPAAAELVEPGDDDDEPVQLPSGRILIIDDDEQVAHSLAILFEGSDITVVSSGREAVRLLASGARFDWIFCDLMMPDLSGMDVYEQAHQAGLGLESRFVFMTGGIFTSRARDFVARVPNPCLSKPFHPRQVVSALRMAGQLPARGR